MKKKGSKLIMKSDQLIKLLQQEIKKTYKIHWLCYDWKNEGVRPIFSIIEDINFNAKQRKYFINIIKLLKKT